MKLSSYCSGGSYYTEVTLDRFLQELWPFVSFSHFINRSSRLRNSSSSFQGILMKLSRYCCHDLKMIIFYWGHAELIFTRVMTLQQFFNSKVCLCNSSCSFQWILVKPSNYCYHDLKRIILYRSRLTIFYQSYGPLSVLAILSTDVLVSATPPTVFKGIWWNYPIIVPMTWSWSYLSRSCSADFYQSYGPLTISQ